MRRTFLALTLLSVLACEPETPAASVVVACDPTGPSPGDVCNGRLLEAVAERWVAAASGTPGVTLRGLVAGRDYSSTEVWEPLPVPAVFGDDVMVGMPAWQQSTVKAFVGHRLEHDRPDTRRTVRSDLVSLLALAAVEASHEKGAVALLVATDGRLVSLGVNAERKVPKSGTVLARIEKSGIALDLSMFSKVVICGIHHVGLDAAEHAALQELWRELVTGRGGPSPVIMPSCLGADESLFAPSPAVAPLPAPADESGANGESGR